MSNFDDDEIEKKIGPKTELDLRGERAAESMKVAFAIGVVLALISASALVATKWL